MTVNMYIATFAWACMLLGFLRRHDRAKHVPLMLTAIFTDIALVLYLQITREAIQKAVSFTLEMLQMIHIGFSTVALLLYFPVLFLGFKLLKGHDVKKWHVRFALTAFFFRTMGFFFMFSMLE
ncbi:MAG: hypothetical protein H6619_01910 [Deltaproteobacteria bacterium]|nr:hypothetical protein [Deltaproteobacteria bacterium]